MQKISTIIVVLNLLIGVLNFEFKDSNQPGVVFGNITLSPGNVIVSVLVDENNAGTISKILMITGVQGSLAMTIDATTKELLQPLLAQASDHEYALIVNQLDYEDLKARMIEPNFLIDFNDDGGSQQMNVNIQNVDDEYPSLTPIHCVMNENEEITVQTSECVLQITDPDGWLDLMEFNTVVEKEGNSSVFTLKYKEVPTQGMSASDIYVVLQTGASLDYESTLFYNFYIQATDSAGHATTPVPVVVEVRDVPDQPPVWQTLQTVIMIDEESPATVQVLAIDGDLGVNSDINYVISDSKGFLHINFTSGVINIDPIDRDRDFDETTFTVTAYEVQDPQSSSVATFTLIINDLDDNIPEISIVGSQEKELNFNLNEGATSIDVDFLVSDLDLGENAAFTAALNTTKQLHYLQIFKLLPTEGDGNTSLKLQILDPSGLDYEFESVRTMKFEIITTGVKTPTNIEVLAVTINLVDLNDESPVFEQSEYIVTIPENATIGNVLATIAATDLDADDAEGIKHDILGPFGNDVLQIEPLGGNVTIIKNDFFDYEKQKVVRFQIRATDKAGNIGFTHLTINLEDVNDETPEITPKMTILEIEERASNTIIKTNVTATDADTTADISFGTDGWWATKNSRPVELSYRCTFSADAISESPNVATAQLEVSSCPLDFEQYDTILIGLKAIDLKTKLNTDRAYATIAIKLIDINDNAPWFSPLPDFFEVKEKSPEGTLVTTIEATDEDVGDIVTYFMTPEDDDTPNWLVIDPETGDVTVTRTEAGPIDSDYGITQLTYNVTATDGVHHTMEQIVFLIVDENGNVPTTPKFLE